MWTLTYFFPLWFLFGPSFAGEFRIFTETTPPPPDGNVTHPKSHVSSITTGKFPQELEDIIIIPADYNKHYYKEYPFISLELYVNNLAFLEEQQKCNVSLWIEVFWTDDRLRLDPNSNMTDWFTLTPPTVLQHIWQPNTELEYKPTRYSSYTTDVSYSNTNKLFWRRWNNRTDCLGCIRFRRVTEVTLSLHVELDYKFFPNDKQITRFWLILPTHDGSDPDLLVQHSFVYFSSEILTQHQSFHTRLASTAFTASLSLRNNASSSTSSSDGRLDLVVLFERKLESYIFKIFVPSGLFVVLAWLSMLLPTGIFAADRVALVATTLLTVTVFYNTAGQSGQDVSYLRALDIWLLGCIAFVFLILFQSIIILRIAARKVKKTKQKDSGRGGDDIKQALRSISTQIEQMQVKLGGVDLAPTAAAIPTTSHANDLESEEKALSRGEQDKEDDELNDHDRSAKIAELIDRLSLMSFGILLAVCKGIYWDWLLNTVQHKCPHDEHCMERLIDTDDFEQEQEKRYDSLSLL